MNILIRRAQAVSRAGLVAGVVTGGIALCFWYAETSDEVDSMGIGYFIAAILGGLACVTALAGGIGLALARSHPRAGMIVAGTGIAVCALPLLVMIVGLLPR